MAIVVQTNMLSLNAQKRLFESSGGLNGALEQLSTGRRISRAADDAANLQIGGRLAGQFQGLNQAVRNANDGIAITQIAEGALAGTEKSLQRIRQLAVQAQNGILSAADKIALNKEANALLDEIDRTAETTEFGGKKLLDGSFRGEFSDGANKGQVMELDLTKLAEGFNRTELGLQGLNVATATVTGGPALAASDISGAGAYPGANQGIVLFENTYSAGERRFAVSNNAGASYEEVVVNFTGNGATDNNLLINAINSTLGGAVVSSAEPSFEDVITNGVQPDFRIAFESTNNADFIDMTAGSIGTYTSSNSGGSSEILSALDNALTQVAETRAELGAKQNAFQSSMRNMMNMAENVGGAKSKIMDTDYAVATADLTKQQIIQQSTVTLMGRAAQIPQSALFLLQN
ncbi:flagellin N-terminal helical domain-containing protein [Aliidiomarina celeris]|uniref:flagellin N-terminal helical domain-containing protein n=1 Tax=Aliidiomarina celeris TaxID=2249428 RepID=UPI000DE9933F|nr:flagellin [Aliidiomarina celeris]